MITKRRIRRWLGFGGGFQRAALLGFVGLAFLFFGSSLSLQAIFLPIATRVQAFFDGILSLWFDGESLRNARHYLAGVFLASGLWLLFVSGKRFIGETLRFLNPSLEGPMMGHFVRRQRLFAGPAVVAIGGGTGLSTLLRGLKQHTTRITAVVTVTDDGGSSGRLASDTGILPPGDIRNCLVALADAERTMTDLFQHRFEVASGSLSGHSMGNLLIAAMVDITGDFEKAVAEISKVLAIRGRVLPATLDRVTLKAEMEDGSILYGETQIASSPLQIRKLHLDPPDPKPLEEALEAIRQADVIVIGPGSVFTSVIPPLLVPGIAEAIAESDALKIYVCNVMTQPGESDKFTASDHVHAIEANVGRRVFDCVLVNKTRPSEQLLERYAKSGQDFVEPDVERIRAMGLRAITANLISETDVVRHDPLRVADTIMRLVNA
ncbi:MAG: putative gluconeogenesis factor [Fimbriimonadales bacterium]|nr:MAG: putative gluconeogenesis factor [Fimbriimonadales bacterium]